MIYNLSLKQTAGGRTANEIYSNDMLFEFDGTLADPRLESLVEDIKDVWVDIMIRQMRVLYGLITEVPDREYQKRARGRFKRVGVTGSGERGPTDQILLPAPLSYVATFEKDSDFGDVGRLKVRGCYYDEDTITGPDLNPTTVSSFIGINFVNFGPQLLNCFTENGAQMVNRAPKGYDWNEMYRPVKAVKYTGLSQHQLYNSSKTVAETTEQLFLREAKGVANSILKLLANNPGGPTPINVLRQAISWLTDLSLRYGLPRVLSYVWPDAVRPYINQLPPAP